MSRVNETLDEIDRLSQSLRPFGDLTLNKAAENTVSSVRCYERTGDAHRPPNVALWRTDDTGGTCTLGNGKNIRASGLNFSSKSEFPASDWREITEAEYDAKAAELTMPNKETCEHDWNFERSSGYPGRRCSKCAKWINEQQWLLIRKIKKEPEAQTRGIKSVFVEEEGSRAGYWVPMAEFVKVLAQELSKS